MYRLYMDAETYAKIKAEIESLHPLLQIVEFPEELQIDEGIIDSYIVPREF